MVHHSSAALKNEISKNIVRSEDGTIDLKNISQIMPNVKINQNVIGFKKEFWIGNYKITIGIH